MMGIIAWVTGQEWFRKAVVVLGLMFAVLLALAGMKRKAYREGRKVERENQRMEVKKAEDRMDAVIRPSFSDLDKRLQDGTF